MEYLFIGGYYDGRRERSNGSPVYKVPLPLNAPQFTKETRGIGVRVETYTLRRFGSRNDGIDFYAIPKLTDYDCLAWLVARYPLAQPKILD